MRLICVNINIFSCNLNYWTFILSKLLVILLVIINKKCPLKSVVKYYIVFVSILFVNSNFAQDSAISKKTVIQRDMIDVSKSVFHIKKDTTTRDSSKLFMSIVPAVGYAMSTGLTGVLASEFAFYLDSETKELSSITGSAYYTQFNQYWFLMNSYITSEKLKLNFLGDWRYYKFPTETYGIGSTNSISDALYIDFSYLKIHEVISREVSNDIFVGVGYHFDYHWKITLADEPIATKEAIEKYGITPKSKTAGISANLLVDNRDNSVNASNGEYLDFRYTFNNQSFGSNLNSQVLLLDLRKYIQFPKESKNVIAFWSYNSFVIKGKVPYLDLPSTGWDAYNNTGRGFIQGRFRSANMTYLETEYRVNLTNNGLLGAVVFTNVQAFSSYGNGSLNTLNWGKGFGLRLKINKKSKMNLALDYGFGDKNSNGLFFNVGEVF